MLLKTFFWVYRQSGYADFDGNDENNEKKVKRNHKMNEMTLKIRESVKISFAKNKYEILIICPISPLGL
jgi:hypothetical protein